MCMRQCNRSGIVCRLILSTDSFFSSGEIVFAPPPPPPPNQIGSKILLRVLLFVNDMCVCMFVRVCVRAFRPSVLPRPYLLKAPEMGVAQEEKDPYAAPAVYGYEHSSSRSRLEPDREARHALLSRGAAGERPRWVVWLVSSLVLGYNCSSVDWQFVAFFFFVLFFLLFYDSFQQKGEKKASFCRIILP